MANLTTEQKKIANDLVSSLNHLNGVSIDFEITESDLEASVHDLTTIFTAKVRGELFKLVIDKVNDNTNMLAVNEYKFINTAENNYELYLTVKNNSMDPNGNGINNIRVFVELNSVLSSNGYLKYNNAPSITAVLQDVELL